MTTVYVIYILVMVLMAGFAFIKVLYPYYSAKKETEKIKNILQELKSK